MTSNETFPLPETRGLVKAEPINIYVDGSHDVASKKGGWAFVVLNGQNVVATQSGSLIADTNNAAEVLATMKAARWASQNSGSSLVTIWSDSMHVVDGCNHWRPIWRNNGWRRYNPNPRARNRRISDWEMWVALDRHLQENPQLTVAWCKGHQGQIGNELADRLAGAAYS